MRKMESMHMKMRTIIIRLCEIKKCIKCAVQSLEGLNAGTKSRIQRLWKHSRTNYLFFDLWGWVLTMIAPRIKKNGPVKTMLSLGQKLCLWEKSHPTIKLFKVTPKWRRWSWHILHIPLKVQVPRETGYHLSGVRRASEVFLCIRRGAGSLSIADSLFLI